MNKISDHLNIDFSKELFVDRLNKFYSERKVDQFIKNSSLAIGLFLFTFPTSLSILNGNLLLLINPTSLIYVLFYLSIYFLLIYLYLNYKSKYQKIDLNYKSNIELFDVLDSNVKILLYNLLNTQNKNPIFTLTKEILKDSSIKYVLQNRMGINSNMLLSSISENKISLDRFLKQFSKYLIAEFLNEKNTFVNKYNVLFVLVKYYYKNFYTKLGFNESNIVAVKDWLKNVNSPLLNDFNNNFVKLNLDYFKLFKPKKSDSYAFLTQDLFLELEDKFKDNKKLIISFKDSYYINSVINNYILKSNYLKKYVLVSIDLQRILEQKKTTEEIIELLKAQLSLLLNLNKEVCIVIESADVLLATSYVFSKKFINIVDSLGLNYIFGLLDVSIDFLEINNIHLGQFVANILEPTSNYRLQIALDYSIELYNIFKVEFSFNAIKHLSTKLSLSNLKEYMFGVARFFKLRNINFVSLESLSEFKFNLTSDFYSLNLDQIKLLNNFKEFMIGNFVNNKNALITLIKKFESSLFKNNSLSGVFFINGKNQFNNARFVNKVSEFINGESNKVLFLDCLIYTNENDFKNYLNNEFIKFFNKNPFGVLYIQNLNSSKKSYLSALNKIINSKKYLNVDLTNNVVFIDSESFSFNNQIHGFLELKDLTYFEVFNLMDSELTTFKLYLLQKGVDLVYNQQSTTDLVDLFLNNLKDYKFLGSLFLELEQSILALKREPYVEVVLDGLKIRNILQF